MSFLDKVSSRKEFHPFNEVNFPMMTFTMRSLFVGKHFTLFRIWSSKLWIKDLSQLSGLFRKLKKCSYVSVITYFYKILSKKFVRWELKLSNNSIIKFDCKFKEDIKRRKEIKKELNKNRNKKRKKNRNNEIKINSKKVILELL